MVGHVSECMIIMDNRYIFLDGNEECMPVYGLLMPITNIIVFCLLFHLRKLLNERRPSVLPIVADVLIELNFIHLLVMNAHIKTNNRKRIHLDICNGRDEK